MMLFLLLKTFNFFRANAENSTTFTECFFLRIRWHMSVNILHHNAYCMKDLKLNLCVSCVFEVSHCSVVYLET